MLSVADSFLNWLEFNSNSQSHTDFWSEMENVANSQSLNQSMESASKHYSSLFSLPTLRRSLLSLAVLCIGLVGASTLILFPSINGLTYSFALGFSLLTITLLSDYCTSHFLLGKDPIFIIRRTVALSMVCWALWLVFIGAGAILGTLFDVWLWIKLCLLGFCTVLTLRSVVFFSSSSVGAMRAAAASVLQPIASILPFIVYWGILDTAILIRILPFLLISPFICLAFAFLFVSLIDREGKKAYGVRSIELFKAFMQNWVVGLNEPIERHLEQLGKDEDVEVSILSFVSSKPKATLIVPTVHPGPFKNVGSSLLPSMLKREFESEKGGEACVPLGLMGHELDLTSQRQNHKVISKVIASAGLLSLVGGATPFVRVSNDVATANCQVFGKTAFLSFTLAPQTTEDLPRELSKILREEATKLGYSSAVLVNAHNSIIEGPYTEPSLDVLRDAASNALSQVSRLTLGPFAVGAATVHPREFSLKDGMGQGGITAIVVKVAQQKTVYAVIDSNNMISGLREKILTALTDMGFDKGEVFTTDTHAVSAVVLGKRGYHPLGEAIDHALLLEYIKEAASKASEQLEECRAGNLSITVPQVRVIGTERLHALSTLVDLAFQRAKQVVVPVFGLEGVLLVVLLSFL